MCKNTELEKEATQADKRKQGKELRIRIGGLLSSSPLIKIIYVQQDGYTSVIFAIHHNLQRKTNYLSTVLLQTKNICMNSYDISYEYCSVQLYLIICPSTIKKYELCVYR